MAQKLKTVVLLAALDGLFLFVGSIVAGRRGLILAAIVTLVLNGVSYWKSDRIAVAAARASEVTPAEAPVLHQIVDELPDEAIDGASVLLKRVALRQLDPDQAWAWTPEWQANLEASLLDVQAGAVTRYAGDAEFLGAL